MIRGMPYGKRFEHCTFENFEVTEKNQEAYTACKRTAEVGDIGVFMMGKNGLGKSHLLVATMKDYDQRRSVTPRQSAERDLVAVPPVTELLKRAKSDSGSADAPPTLSPDEIERQVHVEYWPLLDLTSELRSEVAHGSLEISKRCRECDLLVLDDFGAERVTDFVLEELERIVDWRYRLMKPTSIATNLDFRRITQKYGQRAISRWVGSCEVVTVLGDDRRASMEPR